MAQNKGRAREFQAYSHQPGPLKEEPTSVAFSKRWAVQDHATPASRDGTYTFTAAAHGEYVRMEGLTPVHPNHDGVMVGSVNGVRGMFNGVSGVFKAPSTTANGPGGRRRVTARGHPAWTSLRLASTGITGVLSALLVCLVIS